MVSQKYRIVVSFFDLIGFIYTNLSFSFSSFLCAFFCSDNKEKINKPWFNMQYAQRQLRAIGKVTACIICKTIEQGIHHSTIISFSSIFASRFKKINWSFENHLDRIRHAHILSVNLICKKKRYIGIANTHLVVCNS